MLALILVPALITLAVTILRLVGELNHWSPTLFNPAAGGGGALVGIVWLIPVFGIYFALELRKRGQRPVSVGRAIGFALLAFVLVPAVGFGAVALKVGPLVLGVLFAVASVAAIALAWRGWPALVRVLVAYGFAARIPVAIVMLIAILGNWGTHYDVVPPGFPAMDALPKFFWIGLLPQMTIWIYTTVVLGLLFGAGASALADRRAASTH
jgi:hypothetical protein